MILGKLAQNLKRTSSKVKAHLYASDPKDYLMIQLRVHCSGRETFCDWNSMESAVYRRRFPYRFKPRALRRMSRAYKGRGVEERNMTYVDEEELKEEQDPRVRTTSSGRILKLPNCFY